MSDFRAHAAYTTEVLRDLVGRLIIKHEHTVLQTMSELKAESLTMRRGIEDAIAKYDMRSELFTNDADLIDALVDTLRKAIPPPPEAV